MIEEVDSIYPTYKDLEICCNTIVNSNKYQYQDILTDQEYELLTNNAKIFLVKLKMYKSNFIQSMIDEIKE